MPSEKCRVKDGMNHGPHGIHGRKSFWRLKLFWLGVPGLVFLLWLGVSSQQMNVGAAFRGRSLGVSLDTYGVRFNYLSMGGLIPNDFGFRSRRLLPSDERVLVPPVEWKDEEYPSPVAARSFWIARWLLLIVYVGLWLSLQGAWQCWKGRKLKEVVP